MELIDLLGYFGALAIGIVLGLIGGGGSILTVPILVYIFSINPVTATAYSLFVVGTSSLVGTLNSLKKRLVDFRTALIFAIPAFTAVYITRKYLVPAIPELIYNSGNIVLTRDIAIMFFFAVIMILAAVSMLKRNRKNSTQNAEIQFRTSILCLQGFVVGLVTGLVGAGGGFLIIPALVLLAKLPMKKAIATSLFIISMNSLIGFTGDLQNRAIDWPFLLVFTGIAISGIFIGAYLNRYINNNKLRKIFGWFILIMGIYIIWKELSL